MNIRIVDFGLLTKHYKNYQKGIEEINNLKNEYVKRLEPIRKEMESIVKILSSNIQLDNNKTEREQRFQILQQEAMRIDNEYKDKIKPAKSDLDLKTYEELEEVITEWSKENEIDATFGNNDIVFYKENLDATSHILERLKEKELYTELDYLETIN